MVIYIHTCTFFVDNSELERLRTENKKLLTNFITKDGETVFLRQQLQQIQLRAENEKLEKMHLIEEQANQHRSKINKICKEKEKLKTQIELQVRVYIFIHFCYKYKTNFIIFLLIAYRL